MLPRMNAAERTTVGQRLRAARLSAGLSQVSLAVLAGVSTSPVFQIEAGGHPPPRTSTLVRLGEVLGVSHMWLRTGQDAPTEP
jgi:transcriptional regulator with XRE-family HTH domain